VLYAHKLTTIGRTLEKSSWSQGLCLEQGAACHPPDPHLFFFTLVEETHGSSDQCGSYSLIAVGSGFTACVVKCHVPCCWGPYVLLMTVFWEPFTSSTYLGHMKHITGTVARGISWLCKSKLWDLLSPPHQLHLWNYAGSQTPLASIKGRETHWSEAPYVKSHQQQGNWKYASGKPLPVENPT